MCVCFFFLGGGGQRGFLVTIGKKSRLSKPSLCHPYARATFFLVYCGEFCKSFFFFFFLGGGSGIDAEYINDIIGHHYKPSPEYARDGVYGKCLL